MNISQVIKRITSIRAKGIRLIGILFGLGAIMGITSVILSLFGVEQPVKIIWLGISPLPSTDTLLGFIEISGWQVYVISLATIMFLVIVCIGFLRFWKTAWYVSLFEIGYSVVEGFVGIHSGYAERAIREVVTQHTGMFVYASQIAKINSIILCWAIIHIILFVYVLTEIYWFLPKSVSEPRKHAKFHLAKGVACIFLILCTILWFYVFEDRVKNAYYFNKLKSNDKKQLSLAKERLLKYGITPEQCREMLLRLPQASELQTETITDILLQEGADISAMTQADLPTLYAFSDSSNPKIRELSAKLFACIATIEARKRLVVLLNDSDKTVRYQAVMSLRMIEDVNTADALFETAQKNTGIRITMRIAETLGLMADNRAYSLVEPFLASEDPEERRQAYCALRLFTGTDTIEILNKGLADPALSVRGEVCWMLAVKGNKESIELLIQILKDEDKVYKLSWVAWEDRLHENAASALKSLTGQGFEEDSEAWSSWWKENRNTFDKKDLILTGLQSEDIFRQANSLKFIWQMNLKSAVPLLKEIVSDKDHAWSFFAAEMLADWGYKEGIRYLIDFKDNKAASGNKESAIRHLARATGQNFFDDTSLWLEWYRKAYGDYEGEE